jgi:MFS-type transporter involved in bile tolerance (Atg22 family)
MTIARGTVPLAVFGPHGYGERTGLLGAPSRAAQALAPLLFGLMLNAIGPAVIAVSSALCLAAFAALLLLRASPVEQREADAEASGRN